MSAEHSHAPRCCCPVYQVAPDDHDYEPLGGRIVRETCPACPEHGDLATPYTEQETTK